MKIKSTDLQRAAQLWCKPQHAKKAMDPDFAKSIAAEFAASRVKIEKMRYAAAMLANVAEYCMNRYVSHPSDKASLRTCIKAMRAALAKAGAE